MKKMELKKEQKREDILTAALEVFFSDGYLGAGMDKIAQRAGVTKQTVYRYFDSKEVLLQAALEARRDRTGRLFLEELKGEDPVAALTAFAIGFLELHMSREHLAGIRLMIAEGPRAPEMTRAFFAVGPERTESRLREFIAARFTVDDPEYAVRMLVSTLLSLRMNALVGLCPVPPREERERHARRCVAVCVRGLEKK